jgi:hypothetical protein
MPDDKNLYVEVLEDLVKSVTKEIQHNYPGLERMEFNAGVDVYAGGKSVGINVDDSGKITLPMTTGARRKRGSYPLDGKGDATLCFHFC